MECLNCGVENQESSLYCEECGSPLCEDDRTIIIQDVQKTKKARLILRAGKTYELKTGEITIGRKDINNNPDIDLVRYDKENIISRNHGIFFFKDGKVFFKDTSTNGTYVNGKRLLRNRKAELFNGNDIRFAKLEARVEVV